MTLYVLESGLAIVALGFHIGASLLHKVLDHVQVTVSSSNLQRAAASRWAERLTWALASQTGHANELDLIRVLSAHGGTSADLRSPKALWCDAS